MVATRQFGVKQNLQLRRPASAPGARSHDTGFARRPQPLLLIACDAWRVKSLTVTGPARLHPAPVAAPPFGRPSTRQCAPKHAPPHRQHSDVTDARGLLQERDWRHLRAASAAAAAILGFNS
jgi:hypothetical protein